MLSRGKKKKLRAFLAKELPDERSELLIKNVTDDVKTLEEKLLATDLTIEVEALKKGISDLKEVISDLSTKEVPDYQKGIDAVEKQLTRVNADVSLLEIDTKETLDELKKEVADVSTDNLKLRNDLMYHRGGGAMNRQILIGGTNYLTKYTDINLVSSGVSITAADDNTNKRVDITITGTPLPSLSQFHLYVGDASNQPVDGGAGLTYNGTTLTVANSISVPLILDSGSNQNIDVDNMQLQISGATSLDWQNFELSDTLVRSLNWSTRILYDNNNLVSLRWLTRRLIANDGSTIILDWSTTAAASSSILSLITPVPADKGGTGVANNVASTLTINGAFASTFTITGAFTYTFPTATSTLLANNLGISGGTTLIGGTGAGENLTLSSTSNATKGKIIFGSASAYDQVNDRVGISQTTPTSKVHMNANQNSVTQSDANGILLANATAAINNTQSISPPIVLQGFGWATGVNNSQDVRWRIDVLPVQAATNPTATLQFARSINGAAYSAIVSINSFTGLSSTTGISAVGLNANNGSITNTNCTIGSGGLGSISTQWLAGVNTASLFQYRNLNSGGITTSPQIAASTNVATAGVLHMSLDNANGFVMTAGNGTNRVSRAFISITNLVNTVGAESADLIVGVKPAGAAMAETWRFASTGQLSNTGAVGGAYLELKAGTATAGTGPLKFTSGTSLTAAVAGVMEFTTDDLFFTITTGAARKGVILNDGTNLTSGRVPFATTNGRLIDDADMTFATDTLTVTKIIGSTSITASNLTSGRLVIAGASGILQDDADLTFATDTLTTTKLVITTSLTSVGGTAPVADATYVVYNDGVTSGQVTSFTTKSGIITAVTTIP